MKYFLHLILGTRKRKLFWLSFSIAAFLWTFKSNQVVVGFLVDFSSRSPNAKLILDVGFPAKSPLLGGRIGLRLWKYSIPQSIYIGSSDGCIDSAAVAWTPDSRVVVVDIRNACGESPKLAFDAAQGVFVDFKVFEHLLKLESADTSGNYNSIYRNWGIRKPPKYPQRPWTIR